MKASDLSVESAARSALIDALAVAGGIQALARKLRVPQKQLTSWIEGEIATPPSVFLRTADLLRAA